MRLIGEDIELMFALAEDLDHVQADPTQIEHVIINLAVNARDAMLHGGKLTIKTNKVELDDLSAQNLTGIIPGRYVMITVTDTGCGMDKETMLKIFEPFFTIKKKGQGTGLGLSTVYGIIKQSGGDICVKSEQGQGAIFKIYLPSISAEPDLKESRPEEGERRCGSEHILLVEDEAVLLDLFETNLTELGYQVTTATNGAEAYFLVEDKGMKPDLVITDVVMPGMRGTELVERLRKIQPDLKVICLSGYADNAIENNEEFDAGAHFIQKPFDIDNLAAKIEQVFREKK